MMLKPFCASGRARVSLSALATADVGLLSSVQNEAYSL